MKRRDGKNMQKKKATGTKTDAGSSMKVDEGPLMNEYRLVKFQMVRKYDYPM